MARYTGPQTKIARTFGEPIFGKAISERRNCPPGQHGQNRKRKKLSEYGLQLKEKQKTKFIYGVLERQFRKTFERAAAKGGVTGENLLCLLEQRLDNVVYRLGIAPSRAAARQLVSHCHITVNGAVVNIPSYTIKVGDVIGVRERSKSLEVINESLRSQKISHYSWLEWNAEQMNGKMIQVPQRTEIPETINEQLIVELYSK